VYYLWRLGVWSPTLAAGTTRSHIPGVREYLAVLLDPNIGLVAWMPALAVLTVLGAAALLLTRARRPADLDLKLTTLCCAVSGPTFMYGMTQALNVNSGGTERVSRYTMWLIPLALPFLEAAVMGVERRRPLLITALAVALVAPYLVYFNPARSYAYLWPTRQAALLYEYAPGWYLPLPEIFWERQMGRDTWALQDPGSAATAQCTLILLSKRDPNQPCPLTPEEAEQAQRMFHGGWRSVWIVRQGPLDLGRAGVFGEAR
ncbi:MAG TPA: hypothetical protein VIO14_12305, partial [Dehalococcoidia bacterium]